jgi:hypothetical protein
LKLNDPKSPLLEDEAVDSFWAIGTGTEGGGGKDELMTGLPCDDWVAIATASSSWNN